MIDRTNGIYILLLKNIKIGTWAKNMMLKIERLLETN